MTSYDRRSGVPGTRGAVLPIDPSLQSIAISFKPTSKHYLTVSQAGLGGTHGTRHWNHQKCISQWDKARIQSVITTPGSPGPVKSGRQGLPRKDVSRLGRRAWKRRSARVRDAAAGPSRRPARHLADTAHTTSPCHLADLSAVTSIYRCNFLQLSPFLFISSSKLIHC